MVKNFLAFIGLVFLSLVVIAGVLVLGGFYDSVGLVQIPDELKASAAKLLTPGPVQVRVEGGSQPKWDNPLENLPIVTVTQDGASSYSATDLTVVEPLPTSTPIPPMAPEVYRTESIFQLKRLVAGLEKWLEANDRLAKDNSLVSDPAWTSEMDGLLAEIEQAGTDLGATGPAPEEYQGIAALLGPVADEAQQLTASYREAVRAADPAYFTAAGQHFTRLKEYMTAAVNEMVRLGWSMESN